ncbi:hypothetical protein C8Q76DRAFT_605189, partial [Earliella scabrosa]
PFHRIEEWCGQFIVHHKLLYLGFVYHIGHHGEPWPNAPTGAATQKFLALVITHTNGLYDVELEWCHCPTAQSLNKQLVLADLIPVM